MDEIGGMSLHISQHSGSNHPTIPKAVHPVEGDILLEEPSVWFTSLVG